MKAISGEHERFLKLLQAPPELQAAIDQILDGHATPLHLPKHPRFSNLSLSQGYLREADLAKALNISVRTVRYWMQRGVLPYRKVGRIVLFRRDEVEAALDRFKFSARSEEQVRINRRRRMGRTTEFSSNQINRD
jgi:excisionase family DNA binding protein